MSYRAEIKMNFSEALSVLSDDGMNRYGNDCQRYGIISGCDSDCPVLRNHKCELRFEDNLDLYKEALFYEYKWSDEDIDKFIQQQVA